MRQSLLLEKLKRQELTIGKRSKWRDVASKYDKLHRGSCHEIRVADHPQAEATSRNAYR